MCFSLGELPINRLVRARKLLSQIGPAFEDALAERLHGAASQLGSADPLHEIPALIEALAGENEAARGWAASLLGQVDAQLHKEVVPTLIEALQNENNQRVRHHMTKALRSIDTPQARAALGTSRE